MRFSNKPLSTGALAIFAIVASGSAAAAMCNLFEVPARSGGQAKQVVYGDQRTRWRVTVDLPSATVEVRAGSTRCTTTIADISGVYMGLGNRIVFRTAQVASEQLFTIDAKTCRDIGKPVDIDTANPDAFRKVLRAHAVCQR